MQGSNMSQNRSDKILQFATFPRTPLPSFCVPCKFQFWRRQASRGYQHPTDLVLLWASLNSQARWFHQNSVLTGMANMVARNSNRHTNCTSLVLRCVLHCLTRLYLQKTNLKRKPLGISRGVQQGIKPCIEPLWVWGPEQLPSSPVHEPDPLWKTANPTEDSHQQHTSAPVVLTPHRHSTLCNHCGGCTSISSWL